LGINQNIAYLISIGSGETEVERYKDLKEKIESLKVLDCKSYMRDIRM